MNICDRPIWQKSAPSKPWPEYLEAVTSLPCCVCEAFGLRQASRTQAHHPIHGRYGTRRGPDATCIPLCEGHHQGLRDTTQTALHRAPDAWKAAFGEDTDWIAPTQDKLRHFFEGNTK